MNKSDMKKCLFVLACVLAIVGCKQKQGQTEGEAPATDSVQTTQSDSIQGMLKPAEIGSQWTSKTIH